VYRPLFQAALLVALAGCIVPSGDSSISVDSTEDEDGQPERITTAPSALTADLDPALPQWRVFLGGTTAEDLHGSRKPWERGRKVYYDDAPESDVFAPVIAVRQGDEDNPAKWVQLNLTRHWMAGNRYFSELIECGYVSALDLLVLQFVLATYDTRHEEPPSITTLPAATQVALWDVVRRGRASCKPGPTKSFGLEGVPPYGGPIDGPRLPGDDHTGPAPGRPRPRGGGPPPRPRPRGGRGTRGDRHTVRGPQPQPRPDTGPGTPSLREQNNGVRQGDPQAVPSPMDQTYAPVPGDRQERFKCEGTVYYGYKHGCADFQAIPVTTKWQGKLSSWTNSESFGVNMTHRDWTTLCKALAAMVGPASCLAAIGACGSVDVVTVGAVTIPCIWVTGVICNAHAAVGAVLFDRCDILMGIR
jgi:hypothetical protein